MLNMKHHIVFFVFVFVFYFILFKDIVKLFIFYFFQEGIKYLYPKVSILMKITCQKNPVMLKICQKYKVLKSFGTQNRLPVQKLW